MTVTPGAVVLSDATIPVTGALPALCAFTARWTVSPGSTRPLPPPAPAPPHRSVVSDESMVIASPLQTCGGYRSLSSNSTIVPMSAPALSTALSVQVPDALLPLKTERGCSGRKAPVNGADPFAIGSEAWSSNTVSVKWRPEPPLRFERITVVPSGPVRDRTRSWSNEW